MIFVRIAGDVQNIEASIARLANQTAILRIIFEYEGEAFGNALPDDK